MRKWTAGGLVLRVSPSGGKKWTFRFTSPTRGERREMGIGRADEGYVKLQDAAESLQTDDTLGEWLRALLSRAHRNVVIVALAAKLARIAWATLRRGMGFDPEMGATVTA